MALPDCSTAPGRPIRVLVVDDSVVIRRLIARALETDAQLEVVGSAANGVIALQRIPVLHPDVLTLDIEMPEMDGLETLRRVRAEHPHLRVIMCSTLTEHGAAITLEALSLGAHDYVTKSSAEGTVERAIEQFRADLIPRIKQFFLPTASRVTASCRNADALPHVYATPLVSTPPRVVAIGTSTGGPAALAAVLPKLPADFPLPVLVVQHMPPLFTRLLAERLSTLNKLPMREAVPGEPLTPGKILIAPGDFHMKVAARGSGPCVVLDQSPPLNFCRPAVDALFSSAAEVFGGAVLALVLTGMGQDGLRGAAALKARGAAVLAQDQPSSVVWGMPGAVVQAGLADRVLPLDQCAGELLRLTVHA
ncbi:chemotaxis response regulator protein-glutamate methylesterase [Acidobacteria bacterium AB60]|nr:chemotaxis response regulator protein-glutamate methylesterase [Acidobacteria bacterium AB60]